MCTHNIKKVIPGHPTWYEDAAAYWKNVEATVDGMLGGFSNLDDQDAKDSIAFIEPLIQQGIIQRGSACDCGSGIGRVTKSFLAHFFSPVDLVEQDLHFISTAKADPALNSGLVKRFIHCGLQSFDPFQHGIKYTSIVWCQWVLGHLTDYDLIAFFKRMILVCPVIGVKENVATGQYGDTEVDHQDSSVTRSEPIWLSVFEKSGLKVIKEEWQSAWPDGLYRVKMWCLIPKHSTLKSYEKSAESLDNNVQPRMQFASSTDPCLARKLEKSCCPWFSNFTFEATLVSCCRYRFPLYLMD